MAAEGLAGGYASALVLGVIEGLTEFLPVSSTGHLIVAGHLLGETSEAAKLFEIFIQLGAIAAVCWHERRRVLAMARNAFNPHSPAFWLMLNIGIAFLPAAVLGLLFHGWIKANLFSPHTVAAALMLGGAVILWAERRQTRPRIGDVALLRPRDALAVGLAQSLALFPGVSRAGATIIGAMLWGVSRRAATEFSFLLALPTMFAAALFDLASNRHLLSPTLAGEMALGFVVAFVVALATMRALLRFVASRSFAVFGWYRLAFGAIILLLPAAWFAAA